MNSFVYDLCLSVTGDSMKACVVDTIFLHFLKERALIIWNAWKQFRHRFQKKRNNNSMTNRIIIEYESCDEKEERRFIRVVDGKSFHHDKVFAWNEACHRTRNGDVMNKYGQRIRKEHEQYSSLLSTEYRTTYFNKQGEIACVLTVYQQYSYFDTPCDCTSTTYQYYKHGTVIKTVSHHIQCRFCRQTSSC